MIVPIKKCPQCPFLEFQFNPRKLDYEGFCSLNASVEIDNNNPEDWPEGCPLLDGDIRVRRDREELLKEIMQGDEELGIYDVIKNVANMHPYKQPGNRESYLPYAEGWSDACAEIEGRIKSTESMNGTRGK